MSDDDILALDAKYIWHPFTQAATAAPPLHAVRGSGAMIQTADGKEYVDLVSSWWVNLHGHANPVIARAVAEQAATLEQAIFAEFTHDPAVRLAAKVCQQLPGDLDRVFYSDDGSTAVEVAMKMARQYWSNQGQNRQVYVGFDGGYHGDTVGAMSVGRSSGYFGAWENMLFPVEIAPFPTTWDGDDTIQAREAAALDALDAILDRNRDRIAALIIEPLIQGAAGMRMCRPDFLRAVAERAAQAGTLLILDEVMTGFGRTGASFACVKAGITPDMICLSKGLTGGFLPMAMTVTREFIYQAFLAPQVSRAFLHGHSYTANPLGCAAGLASLELLLGAQCQARIKGIEALHRQRLDHIARLDIVAHPRLCGTIAAFDLPGDGYGAEIGPMLKLQLRERGLLTRPMGNVMYVLPPYCMDDAALHHAWDIIDDVISKISGDAACCASRKSSGPWMTSSAMPSMP
ncbi:adenosylmethionine--8-amino-7-oxononanoate transaminase [Magnetospirillum sulfuroxidans]|uniref:Adenosylmethionine-8-amino-7-oxononanoate aminotransferase n=1 Tax=Magnetospirillum sulfuroxidans TaxID=611300 RepID=A0ABS5IB06_9PROT|nr:adenosylmethionine--8-amino-7-oxononanoate transaminase [Magnetospirillum sulfuroxidans]MBR9971604.1 adenosylmethionine--8-amino-7-oxononanoate transaminase [Magnetospirillum sulfuroxidans]